MHKEIYPLIVNEVFVAFFDKQPVSRSVCSLFTTSPRQLHFTIWTLSYFLR